MTMGSSVHRRFDVFFFFRPLLREMGNPWYSNRKLLHHCNDAYLVRLQYSRGSQLPPSFRCCWEKRNSHAALVVRWDNFCNVLITLVWSTTHNQLLIIETITVISFPPSPVYSQKWLTLNFSLKYPYIIQQKGMKNTQTYLLGIYLDLTPIFRNWFTTKCAAARVEN